MAVCSDRSLKPGVLDKRKRAVSFSYIVWKPGGQGMPGHLSCSPWRWRLCLQDHLMNRTQVHCVCLNSIWNIRIYHCKVKNILKWETLPYLPNITNDNILSFKARDWSSKLVQVIFSSTVRVYLDVIFKVYFWLTRGTISSISQRS